MGCYNVLAKTYFNPLSYWNIEIELQHVNHSSTVVRKSIFIHKYHLMKFIDWYMREYSKTKLNKYLVQQFTNQSKF